jgi:DNA-binding MarR family transcriptional regulator
MGYVLKTQSSQDKRVFHVSLTEAGGQLIKAKYQALKEYGEFIEAALSDEEARQFEATLDKLVKVFKQAD